MKKLEQVHKKRLFVTLFSRRHASTDTLYRRKSLTMFI